MTGLIRDYRLPREAVPTQWLKEPSVWEALLEEMPLTALIRNLATLTRVGLLTPGSDAARKVTAEVASEGRLRKARVHPIAVLSALKTYAQGHGERGGNSWEPVPAVVDALDAAFYASFGSLTPTGKRWLLALDVSGSMASGQIAGVPGLTPRVASAAMALITAGTETQHQFMAFSTKFMPLRISPRQRLDDVLKMTDGLPFSGTDCALPMVWALKNRVAMDVFVVYTDSETWAGTIQPVQALRQYREQMGIPAKLIVCGLVSNSFTIADPDDAGMMDVIGFDDEPHARRLFADLASILIYVLAFVGIIGTVFKQPVTTFLATSGILAIVLGLALQSTLGDLLSGLAINIERPFGAGDWITLADHTCGQVMQVNWRATRLRTWKHDIVIVPNSFITKAIVTNHCRPKGPHRCTIRLNVDFAVSPSRVIEALKVAARSSPSVARATVPLAYARGISEAVIEYELAFAIDSFPQSFAATSDMLERIAASFATLGIRVGAPAVDVRVIHPQGDAAVAARAPRSPAPPHATILLSTILSLVTLGVCIALTA